MIETRRLKNVISIQTILSFVLSRKIIVINIQNIDDNLAIKPDGRLITRWEYNSEM